MPEELKTCPPGHRMTTLRGGGVQLKGIAGKNPKCFLGFLLPIKCVEGEIEGEIWLAPGDNCPRGIKFLCIVLWAQKKKIQHKHKKSAHHKTIPESRYFSISKSELNWNGFLWWCEMFFNFFASKGQQNSLRNTLEIFCCRNGGKWRTCKYSLLVWYTFQSCGCPTLDTA